MYPSNRGVSSHAQRSQTTKQIFHPGEEAYLNKITPLPDERRPDFNPPPQAKIKRVYQTLRRASLEGIKPMKNRRHSAPAHSLGPYMPAEGSVLSPAARRVKTAPVEHIRRRRHRHSMPLIPSSGTYEEFPGVEVLFARHPEGDSPFSVRDLDSDSDSGEETKLEPPSVRKHRRSSLSHRPKLTRESLSVVPNPRVASLQQEATIVDVLRSLSADLKSRQSPGGQSTNSDYVSMESLEHQAENLALFIAKRKGAAQVLEWLLNPHQHIDHLREQATELFFDIDIIGSKMMLLNAILKEEPAISHDCSSDYAQARARVTKIIDDIRTYQHEDENTHQYPARDANDAFGSDKVTTMTYMDKYREGYQRIASEVMGYLRDIDAVGGGDLTAKLFAKIRFEFEQSESQLEQLSLVRFDLEKGPAQFSQGRDLHLDMAQMASGHLSSAESTAYGSSVSSTSESPVFQLTPEDIAEFHTVAVGVNTTDNHGNSLIQLALQSKNYEMANMLFKQGANIGHRNDAGVAVSLNQVAVSKHMLSEVIVDYNHDHMEFAKENIKKLRQLIDASGQVSIGEVLKILLFNKGGWGNRSVKTLLAYHLGVGIDPKNPLDEAHSCQYVADWYIEMVKLKLGMQGDDFARSSQFILQLTQYAIERAESEKGRAILDKLFSMDSMDLVAQGRCDDENVFKMLDETFCKTWETHIGVLKTPIGETISAKRNCFGASTFYDSFKQANSNQAAATDIGIDFRSSLDRAMNIYQQQHLILWFKTNYQNAKTTLKAADHNMQLGGVMRILLSKSGAWDAGRSFKRLLAHSLGVAEMGGAKRLDNATAQNRVKIWCEVQLRRKLFGPTSAYLTRSLGYLRNMLRSTFNVMHKPFGEKKAMAILDTLYNLDTRHLHGCDNLDNVMLRFLKSQLEPKEDYACGQKNVPTLARAFSQPRMIGKSKMAENLFRSAPQAISVHA